jgi:hypothetical protein
MEADNMDLEKEARERDDRMDKERKKTEKVKRKWRIILRRR